MIQLLAIGLLSFVAMEFVSYLAHRYVYHKLLWVFHRSHHQKRKGLFEWNDVFPLVFASIAVTMMISGLASTEGSILVAISIGVSLYGLLYFFVHDLYVHRRARWMRVRIPALMTIKKAHAVHHRTGGEPYGLLFFLDREEASTEQVREDEAV